MQPFFLLVISAIASMLVIPLASRLAPWMGMVDAPDPRKVHKTPVPRVGGWGIVAGCLVAVALLRDADRLHLSFALGILVLFAFGAWDDAKQISHWPKFVGQFLAVGLVVFWGDLYVTRLPFFDEAVLSPLAGKILTSIAMVGVINAINHSDGLDGLAAGETLLSLIAVAFLGYLVNANLVVELALTVIGGIIGFLCYNTHPARVFMGDAGSQALGFSLSLIIVYLMQKANSAASAALPLLLLGLPIADILVVLYRRASGGMNWFKATRNHVHHRLLDLGFTHFKAVVLIYSFQALLVVSAVPLRYAPDLVVIGVYFIAILGLFGCLMLAERKNWRAAPEPAVQPRALSAEQNAARTLREARWHELFCWAIAVMVCGIMLFAVLRSGDVPRDFGVTACIALALAVVTILWQRSWNVFMLRLIAYGTAVIATYLFITYPASPDAMPMKGFSAAILTLAAMLGVFVRFFSKGRFNATPTDYLIAYALIVLLALGLIGGGGFASGSALQIVTFPIVLFYGCEVVINHLHRWRPVLGSAAMAALLIVAVRGLTTAF
ncbi:MAG: undecaprenyl/decaprenyl-phosphate alpha-N-acetylglucosaminyl 1-phosphate transferase [Nevskiaceae bacterium]|jgi:UDP-GlcNAc:undecaprenyl-phosphate GlcNAc-1-phosphate transferase|nr:undecaprenyl/decaprenyl-phosphate alpha-N-acetylglucosaminyl 1-phosphate transferase [Nevskiaceae bacterium]